MSLLCQAVTNSWFWTFHCFISNVLNKRMLDECGVCCASLGLWKDQTSASWRRYNQKGVYYLMSKARWRNILDTLQDEVKTPWRKSLCKVVSKGEGSLEHLEPDGSTKSNLWSDAPFMSFTTLSRIVRGGVMLLQKGRELSVMTGPYFFHS